MSLPLRDPYHTDCPLFLHVAKGVEAEPGGRRVAGSVQLWATDGADAVRQARAVFSDVSPLEIRRLPLPAVEPPGFGDDAQRVAWSEARQAYYDRLNAEYRAERALDAEGARAAA